mmetsp:Transcript_25809/g.50528  ORF Transcript_25809/g.50528 Transcript_25809/m.50528 type:complete len:268 (+) Transcript_25809:2012-2815(+)
MTKRNEGKESDKRNRWREEHEKDFLSDRWMERDITNTHTFAQARMSHARMNLYNGLMDVECAKAVAQFDHSCSYGTDTKSIENRWKAKARRAKDPALHLANSFSQDLFYLSAFFNVPLPLPSLDFLFPGMSNRIDHGIFLPSPTFSLLLSSFGGALSRFAVSLHVLTHAYHVHSFRNELGPVTSTFLLPALSSLTHTHTVVRSHMEEGLRHSLKAYACTSIMQRPSSISLFPLPPSPSLPDGNSRHNQRNPKKGAVTCHADELRDST